MPKYYSPTPEEIRALRARLNYTQTEMAEFLMCSTNAYCKWEQGATKMYPVVWNAVQIVVAQAEPKPRKLTVYEQRRLENQKVEDDEAEAMRRLREEWAEESTHDSKNDTEEALIQRQILNQFRVQKEIMITKIEEVSPKNGAEARRQFPDYDNIQIPMVQEHIKRLTPMYNSVKDS